MITIKKNGKFIIPDKEVFIGHTGDNLHATKEFFVEGVTDVSLIYRMYLQFDDGTTNFFLLDSETTGKGTKLTWNVTNEQIYKGGILKMQIKASNSSGIVFHSAVTSLVVHTSIEFGEVYKDKENSEFLQHEEFLNDLLQKERAAMEELKKLLEGATGGINLDDEPIEDSAKAVKSGGIYNALAKKLDDADNSVKNNNITNDAVTFEKLSRGMVADSGNSGNALAFANDTTLPTTKLVKGWIEGMLEDVKGSIGSGEIADGSIGSEKLTSDLFDKIEGTAVALAILSTSVTDLKGEVKKTADSFADKLDDIDNSVKSNNIANSSVGLSKLDRNLVTTSANSGNALAFANDTTLPTTLLVKGWLEGMVEDIDNAIKYPFTLEWEKGALSTDEGTLGQEVVTSSHLRTNFQDVSLFNKIYFDLVNNNGYRYNVIWFNSDKTGIGYLDLGSKMTHDYSAEIVIPDNAVYARFILWKNGGISLDEESAISITGIAEDSTAWIAEKIRQITPAKIEATTEYFSGYYELSTNKLTIAGGISVTNEVNSANFVLPKYIPVWNASVVGKGHSGKHYIIDVSQAGPTILFTVLNMDGTKPTEADTVNFAVTTLKS